MDNVNVRHFHPVKAGLIGSLALSTALWGFAPTIAAAQDMTDGVGNTGTTKVTVVANEGNLKFRVPTVIPFVADYDGTLQGPSAASTYIENLSAFSIKVTNLKVTPADGWTHTASLDAQDNSVEWHIGPTGSLVTASNAVSETGVDITSEAWDMSYSGAAENSDKIYLTTDGQAKRVTKDISSAVQIGTITFTVAPGTHANAAIKNDVTKIDGLDSKDDSSDSGALGDLEDETGSL